MRAGAGLGPIQVEDKRGGCTSARFEMRLRRISGSVLRKVR